MDKFIFINDAMNLSQLEALKKAAELNVDKIALVETARDNENAIDAWLLDDYEVIRFAPTMALDAVMGHQITVIEEDSVSDATLERLGKYAEIVE